MKKQLITAAITLGIMTTGFVNQAEAHELTHKVQPGETLWKIATTNNLTVDQLTQYNRLSSSTIYVGQELSLLAPHTHDTGTTSSSYTVKSGDSLWSIANTYKTTVTNLKSLNNLASDTIKVGQVLKLPGTAAQQAPVIQPTTAKTYTVQSGDTLWKIATSNKLSVAQLKSYNNLTSDTVHVGQVLRLTASTTDPSVQDQKLSFNADALIAEGKKYIGVPYKWGGTTPQGFDCSGFLNYVFNKQGITIPRTVSAIWSAGTPVTAPQKGDIVFFTTYAPGASHAGIFLGDNKFLHASSSVGVTISDLNNSYWKPRYLGAKSLR
jgi:LysM repeat protein